MRPAILPLSLTLAGCLATGAIADPYGNPNTTWMLVAINGAPFSQRATLSFHEPGKFSGKAPCNSYVGTLTATFPAFAAGPIAATRMACLDLDAEDRFFTALSAMTAAEEKDGTLILTGTITTETTGEAAEEGSEPETDATAEDEPEEPSGETEEAGSEQPTTTTENVTMVFIPVD